MTALAKGGKHPVIVDENGSVQDEIVEQIALRLAADVSNKKTVLKLETTSLYSNFRDSDKFDAVVASIVDTVLATKGTSVLFVESLTALVSAKRQNATFVDAIRSGKLKLIGASTFAAYEEEIAGDQELSRLFEVVPVVRPAANNEARNIDPSTDPDFRGDNVSPDLRQMMAADPTGSKRLNVIVQAKDAKSSMLRTQLTNGSAKIVSRIGKSDTLVVTPP